MKKCFLSTYHPFKDAKYALTSFVHGINATPSHGAFLQGGAGGCLNCLMRRKPSFGLGLLGGFPLRKFVGAFTQGVTLDMVGWYFPHVLEHKIQ